MGTGQACACSPVGSSHLLKAGDGLEMALISVGTSAPWMHLPCSLKLLGQQAWAQWHGETHLI